jgi:hypothetical protein
MGYQDCGFRSGVVVWDGNLSGKDIPDAKQALGIRASAIGCDHFNFNIPKGMRFVKLGFESANVSFQRQQPQGGILGQKKLVKNRTILYVMAHCI